MEGYFFLHFYDLDEDTIESYRKGIKEEIIPAIKTNVKKLMQYMVSLHENEVPNEMHVDLISYGADVVRQHFHEDFLRMYGRYGIHTLNFDSLDELDESERIEPVTITYMFNQEYTDVPIMIDEVSDYFLQNELTTIRNRRQIGRSFNKTLKSVLDNCNRLGKKKNLHFGVVDMSEKDINDCGGFREFLMNGRIDIVEEEPAIQKNGTTQTSRRPGPSLSWKGVSRSTEEWESVYRNKHDFGDIDGIIPDADSIAINNKYTEQYMDWWDLMNSTATKY